MSKIFGRSASRRNKQILEDNSSEVSAARGWNMNMMVVSFQLTYPDAVLYSVCGMKARQQKC